MALRKGSDWHGAADYSRPSANPNTKPNEGTASDDVGSWKGEEDMSRPTASPQSDKVKLVGGSKSKD